MSRLFTIRKRRREIARCRELTESIHNFLASRPKTTSLEAFRKQLQAARLELNRYTKSLARIEDTNRSGTYSPVNQFSALIEEAQSRIDDIIALDAGHVHRLGNLKIEAADFAATAASFPHLLPSVQTMQRRVNELCRQCSLARAENQLHAVLRTVHSEVARMERDTSAALRATEQLPEMTEIEKTLPTLKGHASPLSRTELEDLESTLAKGKEDFAAGRYIRARAEFKAVRSIHSRIVSISAAEHTAAINDIELWLNDAGLYKSLAERHSGDLRALLADRSSDAFLGRWSALRERMAEDVMKAASTTEDIQILYIKERHRMRASSKLFIETTPSDSLAAFARASVRHCRKGERIGNI